MSVVLGPTDVALVRRGLLEDGPQITGNLEPVERVQVRARLEGDLVGVYAREGERVTRGQLLARFEASEQESDRRSAEADRVAAQTQLATATWNTEQADELFKAGAIPERDLKAAQQEVAAARARLAAADARMRSTSSFVTDTRVASPTDGVVERRLVESGERVSRGAELFSVVRADVLELAAAVPSRRADELRAGQVVHFSADGRRFDGRVARVSPTIDPASRSVTIYVQVPNADGALKGGTYASGRVVGRTIPDALIVPTAAIRQMQDQSTQFVWRIAGTTIDQATVRLGVVDDAGGVAQVLDGLREGDRVVVGNVGTLGRGMQVQIVGGENAGAVGGNRDSAGGTPAVRRVQ
ncbi:MAG TPA: efflux RND transporter periplasmic adaptor subunit [Gemmatimonadaceae bacterium]|nr:efflux RND transporter periplasmic adaptor subunit [Gemmatimonadaceae bacterium]